MIPPHPFFGSSNFRRPYHYYSYPRTSHNNLHTFSENSKSEQEKPCFPNDCSKNEKNFNNSSNNTETRNCNINNINTIENNSDECFEIFGLKLHFDDLLIIALLLFLYQENVKDTYLYIALILLLLS